MVAFTEVLEREAQDRLKQFIANPTIYTVLPQDDLKHLPDEQRE